MHVLYHDMKLDICFTFGGHSAHYRTVVRRCVRAVDTSRLQRVVLPVLYRQGRPEIPLRISASSSVMSVLVPEC